MQYKYLVFQGGGVKGIAYIGALTYLKEIGILQGLQGAAGASAGAITAMLLAAGYKVCEIKEALWSLSLKVFKDDKFGYIRDLFNIFYKYGLCPGDALLHWLEQKLKEKIGTKKVSFSQLPLQLKVVATNLNTGKPVVLPQEDMKDDVALAVRMSAGFPVFYQPVRIRSDYYADGGIVQNFPIGIFPAEGTLGLVLQDKAFSESQRYKITNFKSYLVALFETLYNTAQTAYVRQEDYEKAIKIPIPDKISTMDMSLSDQEKELLFEIGYKTAKVYMFKERMKEKEAKEVI